MTFVKVLAGWCLLSIIAGPLVGAFLAFGLGNEESEQ